MSFIDELKQKKYKLSLDMRNILNDAEKREDKSLSVDEKNKFDAMAEEIEKIEDDIKRREKHNSIEKSIGKLDADPVKVQPEDQKRELNKIETPEDIKKRSFNKFLKRGSGSLSVDEYRSLQADVDAQAGYVIAPQDFRAQIIEGVRDQVFVRQLATVTTLTTAHSLGLVVNSTRAEDATWTSEIQTADEETALAYSKRELFPHQLKKLIKVSEKLMTLSSVGIEQEVISQISYKFAITEEKAFMSGTGSQQPLGLFTASNDGISTSRDVSTGNTTTEIKGDGLIEALHSLKPQYMSSPRTRWMFHRDAIKMVRKLKDGNGQYVWMPGLSQGSPGTILGIPYIMSEYVPNTFTTGLYVGMVGDFSKYYIADTLDLQVVRLDELYRATSQIGFIFTQWLDGMPVLEEAFARVKLA